MISESGRQPPDKAVALTCSTSAQSPAHAHKPAAATPAVAEPVVVLTTKLTTIRSTELRPDATAAAERPTNLLCDVPFAKLPPVRASGKFLFHGNRKFYVKGVTYGVFNPSENGCEYHNPDVVERDFLQMSQSKFNLIRTYTVPPRWLLDLAQQYELQVLVGLPWEQHVAFLEDSRTPRRIIKSIAQGVRACAGHQAVLGYAVGNEIPSPIVRWHGRVAVEKFLHRLYDTAKDADSMRLVTYVNYPSTEFLQLPFMDMLAFNVYLETPEKLNAYLARLQNIAGSKPLLIAELGLDSMRNGLDLQSRTLKWQIQSTFDAGCAGAIVFSWTDEWYRGGCDIDDWAFGLTDRQRQPKPALNSVSHAMAEAPFAADRQWPRISVVVCTYNGQRTIRQCLQELTRLPYPDYEVIVVNDGSTDATPSIISQFPVRQINVHNGGLSIARNIGMHHATGEIIAYIDDDAYPDPHWLHYLARAFEDEQFASIGGPNIPPADEGMVAKCVFESPGGPTHVLSTDIVAEHLPGCNMAFRRSALLAINGFDARFRVAGDDVDLCWRLQQAGWKLGFSPASVVWHRRRSSVRAYLRQQRGYGRAEAMLCRKWPDKYNHLGHCSWGGRIYGNALPQPLLLRPRVYHGVWGSQPFQSLYQPTPHSISCLPLMPEWYLLMAVFAAVSLLGLIWPPLLLGLLPFVATMSLMLVQACRSAARVHLADVSPLKRAIMRLMIAFLHVAQPLERLIGRLSIGLTPWRRPGRGKLLPSACKNLAIWSHRWVSFEERIEQLENRLRRFGATVRRGGPCDRWELKVHGGLLAAIRILATVEEHGSGRQLVRLRSTPHFSRVGLWMFIVLAAISAAAGATGSWLGWLVPAGICLVMLLWAAVDLASVMTVYRRAACADESSKRRGRNKA